MEKIVLHKKERIIKKSNIIYKNKGGNNYYVKVISKNACHLLNWFRIRNSISIITSYNRLAIYHRSRRNLCWFYVACLLEYKGGRYI